MHPWEIEFQPLDGVHRMLMTNWLDITEGTGTLAEGLDDS